MQECGAGTVFHGNDAVKREAVAALFRGNGDGHGVKFGAAAAKTTVFAHLIAYTARKRRDFTVFLARKQRQNVCAAAFKKRQRHFFRCDRRGIRKNIGKMQIGNIV